MLSRKYVNYQGKSVPRLVGAKGGCFPGSTLVSMADGSKKPIASINPSDIVLSFKKFGELGPGTVSKVHKHYDHEVWRVTHKYGSLEITPNHWVIGSDNLFKELKDFSVGEELVLEDGTYSEILHLEKIDNDDVYTLTVEEHHTFIAENVRVHNKGGGKDQGGKEDPNSLFSTDILFSTVGLGEGPIYKVNSNGPQDIEINDGNIDDLINLDGDGTENNRFFKTLYNTGTTTQGPLRVFGEQTVSPQYFQSPVTLKKGNLDETPQSRVFRQNTSAQAWDALKFIFTVASLLEYKENGDIVKRSMSVKITVFNSEGIELVERIRDIEGKTNTPFRFNEKIEIPEEARDPNGYLFTIEKESDDSSSSKIQENVQLIGWFEIENQAQAYPRTAHIGYALKAFNEHVGGVPTFTSMVKGLLVKVPSNYNQPILKNGEIDWRELEVRDVYTSDAITITGYTNTNPGVLNVTGDISSFTSGYPINIFNIVGDGSAAGVPEGLYYVEPDSNAGTLTVYQDPDLQYPADWSSGTFTGTSSELRVVGSYNVRDTNQHVDPTISLSDSFYFHDVWSSTGYSWGVSPIDFTSFFSLDQAGDYVVKISGYANGNKSVGADINVQVYVDDVLINQISLDMPSRETSYDEQIRFSLKKRSNIKIVTKMTSVRGLNESRVEVVSATSEDKTLPGTDVYVSGGRLNLGSATSYQGAGYRLQFSGETLLFEANPQIYVGAWDGRFVYSWTQNPVWIIYDLLTNKTYGLGIPEENIDKFKFYKIAKYCDACDDVTGRFIGVEALADGTFRHKPQGYYTETRNILKGLDNNIKIKERRFTLDVVITDIGPALDLLNKLCSTFRAALVYSGGKITLAVDMPDEYPVAIFNEANIKAGSVNISGVKETELLTGVEVSYIEPTNHYIRETVRIDINDANDGTDRSTIENVNSMDLYGVTRRSQALRFAQYQIAASKYLRRKIEFTTSTDALTLSPGDVIAFQQRMVGVAYGYGGKVAANSNTVVSNVLLEHLTTPTITNSFFTNNTYPIALRVIQLDTERIDLYLLDSSLYALTSTDNVSAGADFIEVRVSSRYDPISKSFTAVSAFSDNTVPKAGDLWSLGEWVNINDFYTNTSDKLFKITSLTREPENEEVIVSAIEYISNVYIDSDTFIDYTPTAYLDTQSPLQAPPSPVFNLSARPIRNLDGSVRVDLYIESFSDIQNYGIQFETEYFISFPDGTELVANLIPAAAATVDPLGPL